jgi:sigma-B regulation protein RsbU (phosphoserine phosphatase)
MYRELLFPSLGEVEELTQLQKTLIREIQLARNIQMKLLNCDIPQLLSGEVAGISIPARLIGGDYYDFYPLTNGKIRIIIGDVMGKGIPAAMLMILTRGAFRSASETTQGPGETLTAMNNAMNADLRKLNSFVTVFCADWDPSTGDFVYANAGHIPPLIIRSHSHIFEAPAAKGIMLGGLPDQIYQEERCQLKEDDLVFIYTDGIIEANNKDGEMFKSARLVEILIESGHEKAAFIEDCIVTKLNVFTDGLPQKDDITMVILKVGSETTTEISRLNASVRSPVEVT